MKLCLLDLDSNMPIHVEVQGAHEITFERWFAVGIVPHFGEMMKMILLCWRTLFRCPCMVGFQKLRSDKSLLNMQHS